MTTEKISITLDRTLLAEARRRARGTLSGYLNEALRRRILAERHAEYLDQLDEEFGALTEEERRAGEQIWDSLKADLK